MPNLPLDHPEPFAATLGVMLYPSADEDEQRKARAFASQYLAEPLRRFDEAGFQLPYASLVRVAMDSGYPLNDLDERWRGGVAIGELFKTLYVLAKDDPKKASWENAIRIYELSAIRAGVPASRSSLWKTKTRYISVAALWGAWQIREGRFGSCPEREFDGFDDFQFFLAEAEVLRDFGQRWRPPRAKSVPPLPRDVWRVPRHWKPPLGQSPWSTGSPPNITLPEDLVTGLKPAGRPAKAAKPV
jgi:hypothetical protein